MSRAVLIGRVPLAAYLSIPSSGIGLILVHVLATLALSSVGGWSQVVATVPAT